MNSRATQDLILRLLADAPFRAGASWFAEPEVAQVLAQVDRAGLERFGRFLCRHYYRERIVHYFKYSRALAPITRRPPEGVLKTAEFSTLMPALILGEHKSAERVLALLDRHLLSDADSIRTKIPYWDDLVLYQSVFFLSDALPPPQEATPFPARAQTARILELSWDLPTILPRLLQPFEELPLPVGGKTRLIFARSPRGEVTVLRCTAALKDLLESLTGKEDPSQIAARLGLDRGSFEATLRRLEEMGAVLAQESFSASHKGSDITPKLTAKPG